LIIGALEAGQFPAIIMLVSCWYSRYDVHKRFSVFYLLGVIGSAIAPILAYGFMQMGGIQGLAAWRWIFIMEGLLTIAVAGISWMLLVDYPHDSHKIWRFLTKKEEAFIIRRINRDREDAGSSVVEKFNLREFMRPGLDWTVWSYAIIYL
jgi:MFS family permease